MSAPSDPIAVLFADLGGSTRLYDLLGDERARRIVATCINRIIEVVEAHGGTVIKTIGDEVMTTFPTADQAADASEAILRSMQETRAPHEERLGAHVGFHCGRVLHEGGDVFGDTVNLAARVVGLAKNFEILATGQAIDALSSERRERTRRLDRREVKGRQGRLEIFELLWQTTNLTMMTPVLDAEIAGPGRLVLRGGEERFALSEQRPAITIGRDPENDVVVPEPQVSWRHAGVRLQHGKFVLYDESTNGTFVRTREGKTIRLKREELILPDSGSIGLGGVPDADGELPITFRFEA